MKVQELKKRDEILVFDITYQAAKGMKGVRTTKVCGP